MKVEINKSEELFDVLDLKENTIYKVKVKVRSDNPEHNAILFTGFKNGDYCEVYSNNYDAPIKMMDLYSIKVIKKLTTLK